MKLFKDITPFPSKNLDTIYNFVKENILSKLYDDFIPDCAPLGSYKKKLSSASYEDIDIGVDLGFLPTISQIDSYSAKIPYESKVLYGLNQISIRIPHTINNELVFGQVDLMFGDLNWLTFAYSSPDFTKQESKYKGLYRTILLQSVISVVNKNYIGFMNTLVDGEWKNQVIQYEHYAMRLNSGIWKVKKSLLGKSKKIVKTPTIESETLIHSSPETIAMSYFNTTPEKINSFENIWNIINEPNWHYHIYLDLIKDKFFERLKTDKYEMPFECITGFSILPTFNLFVGGFKPMTGAHYEMIVDTLTNYNSRAVIFIGPKERDGITQDDSFKIANLIFSSYSNVEIIKTERNPMIEMFNWLEQPHRSVGNYCLHSGNKDDDFYKSFEFYESYKPGGKYRHNLPPQVEVKPTKLSSPSTYKKGKRKGEVISASFLREDIKNDDFKSFCTNYPEHFDKNKLESIWKILNQIFINKLQEI